MASNPIYKKIFKDILLEIEGGLYPPQSRLKSENELCQEYNTSRPTVRLAIDMLIGRRLVERIPGKGTFVLDRNGHPQGEAATTIAIISPHHAESIDGQLLIEAKLLQGIRQVFSEKSSLILQTYPDDEAQYGQFLNRLVSEKINGAVFISPPVKIQKMLIRVQLPLVVFGHLLPGIDLPHISLNLFKMGYELAHQLVQRGHRQFGLMADVENIGIKRLIAGIDNAMIDYHLPWDDDLRLAIHDAQECTEALDRFIQKQVTCIVLDEMDYAPIVRHHLISTNHRVPEDISLVLLEMHKNMILRPPFYTGFYTDHLAHGLQGAKMLKLIMMGDRPDSTFSQIIIPLTYFEGRTLKKMSPARNPMNTSNIS